MHDFISHLSEPAAPEEKVTMRVDWEGNPHWLIYEKPATIARDGRELGKVTLIDRRNPSSNCPPLNMLVRPEKIYDADVRDELFETAWAMRARTPRGKELIAAGYVSAPIEVYCGGSLVGRFVVRPPFDLEHRKHETEYTLIPEENLPGRMPGVVNNK